MELRERQVKGVAVVDVSADFALPTENPRPLRDKVVALLQRGERLILLNLSNVLHTDGSFLAEIVDSYKAATAKGGVLKLEHVEPHLRTVLHTTALERIFNPYRRRRRGHRQLSAVVLMIETLRGRRPSGFLRELVTTPFIVVVGPLGTA